MNAITRWLQQRKVNKTIVEALHDRLIQQVRSPAFYLHGHAQDRLEDRFELACLHATLLLRRIREIEPQGKELAQALFDRVFYGFDHALREEGVGDLSVGKRIRKMGEAFYGRAKAYDKALEADDRGFAVAHAISLALNQDAGSRKVIELASYVLEAEDGLRAQSDEAAMAGTLDWPQPVLDA